MTSVNRPQVRDYEHMLALINGILTTAPAFNRTGLVGFPMKPSSMVADGNRGVFAAFRTMMSSPPSRRSS